MSVEKPATLANVPISRNNGTVARSALARIPVGSLTSSVTAGPHPACSANPTTPTMIMAKPIGTCSSISANSARMPKPPMARGLMVTSSVHRALRLADDAEHAPDAEGQGDELHGGSDPEDDVGGVPERRRRNFQHIGALATGDELTGVDPELPGHQPEHDRDRKVGEHIEHAAERRAGRRRQAEGDVAALHH